MKYRTMVHRSLATLKLHSNWSGPLTTNFETFASKSLNKQVITLRALRSLVFHFSVERSLSWPNSGLTMSARRPLRDNFIHILHSQWKYCDNRSKCPIGTLNIEEMLTFTTVLNRKTYLDSLVFFRLTLSRSFWLMFRHCRSTLQTKKSVTNWSVHLKH